MNGATRAMRAAAIIAATFCGIAAACAQPAAYPTRPIKLIVSFAAGGVGDIVARILAEKLRADLGQPIIVENRAGGSGVIAMQATVRSEPDGYTLLQMSPSSVILPSFQSVPYDWERDLIPVAGIGSVPLVIAVHSRSGVRSIADLAAAAKSTRGGLSYGSSGTGSVTHLAAVRLLQELKADATHIPFRGNIGAVQALIADQVQFIFATTADVIEYEKSGDFRLVAVTSEKRVPNLPNVPTMSELKFTDFNPTIWYSYAVPAKTPIDAVNRLYESFAKAAGAADVQERLGALGLTVSLSNGAEIGSLMRDDAVRWRRVIEQSNIKLE